MDALPNELLLLIFQHLAPSFVHPPRRVAEVCRLWRSQSLLLPELRCVLPLVTLERRILPEDIGSGRSKFAICGFHPRRKNHPDFLALSQRSEQWDHAELLSVHSQSIRPLSSALVNNVPLLRTLKVRIPDNGESYGGFLYAFENAPILRHVEVECHLRLNLKIPFSQIRTYVERSDYSLGIVQVLQPESKIEDLSYYTDNPTPIVTAYSPSGPIPYLSSLNLHLRWCAVEHVLAPLDLPALERFKVVSDSPSVLNSIESLIIRCGCSLKTLSITIRGPDPAQFTPLLEHCCDLEQLELSTLSRETLVGIVCSPDRSYLPRLREFIAHLGDDNDDTPFTPNHGRIAFVRLVFQSKGARIKAHQQLEHTLVDLPSNLVNWVRILEKAADARNLEHGVLTRVFRSIAGKSTRSSIERALSDVESYPFTDGYQIVVSDALYFAAFAPTDFASSSVAFVYHSMRYSLSQTPRSSQAYERF
ncbi:hypothetical protein MD484_g8031, partial [Candolleomyces efflorescens]